MFCIGWKISLLHAWQAVGLHLTTLLTLRLLRRPMQTLPETRSNQKVSVEPMFWGRHVVVSTKHAGKHAGVLQLF